MSRLIQSSSIAILLAVTLIAGRVRAAENEGQADLDQATETKLTATSLKDLSEVIRLLNSAIQQGLDEGNTRFANDLLASTLVERGSVRTRLIFQSPPPAAKLSEFRQLALDDLEEGIKLNPKQPQALFDVARLHLLPGGDRQRAAEALDGTIDLAADQPDLRAKVLTFRAGMEKDADKKLADLDEAIRLVPHDPVALRTRGLLLAQQEKPEAALADFNRAIELAPKHAATYEVKAVVLAGLKKYDEALVSLDKAHELQPDSVYPLMHKARIHARQDNLPAALIDLHLAQSIDPQNTDVLLLRAGVHQELKDTEKALADVDKALELKPELPTARRVRALLLAQADKMDEAIAELEKIRKSDPKDVATLLQLGMFYIAEKKHQQAVDVYSAVLAQRPDDWMALRGRGDSLLNVGKHQEAVADYEKAVKLRPKDPGILNNFAWVLATSPDETLRDGKRAVTLATEACQLTNYKQAHILSTLGAAYAETGDFDAAIKWVEKGIEVADEQQKEPLNKELESYRIGKPWREVFSPEKPEEKP